MENIPNNKIIEKIEEINSWSNKRVNEYEVVTNQLNLLYDDIDNGLFGANAKNGEWYKSIKAIKDNSPKPDNLAILQKELDVLIQNDIEEV
jgi:CRISPR/Cas system CSM-associated protein Csm2 small subunit